jgi:tetratricopeptide (TPR) repeat protein
VAGLCQEEVLEGSNVVKSVVPVFFRRCGGPLVGVFVLWALGSLAAIRIVNMPGMWFGTGPTLAGRVLGRASGLLADDFVETADETFHRGRSHQRDKAFEDHYYQVIARSISPAGHRHLEGREVREIMPWLRLAVMLEPHNVENYLIASYWLGKSGDIGAALRVLQEAQMNNPESYLVYLGKGRFFAKGDAKEEAGRAYDTALMLWPGEKGPDDEEARQDLREILGTRAVLSGLQGNAEQTLQILRNLVSLFPDKSRPFRDQIAAISRGDDVRVLARARWEVIKVMEYYLFCEEDDHVGEGGEGSSSDEHAGLRHE